MSSEAPSLLRKMFFLDGLVAEQQDNLSKQTIAAIPIMNQVQILPVCNAEKGLLPSHCINPKDAIDGTGISFCTTCKHLLC